MQTNLRRKQREFFKCAVIGWIITGWILTVCAFVLYGCGNPDVSKETNEGVSAKIYTAEIIDVDDNVIEVNIDGDIYSFYGSGFAENTEVNVVMANNEIVNAYY